MLIKRQEKILDNWINSQRETNEMLKIVNDNAPYTKNRFRLDMDDLPIEIFNKLEEIRDCETLYQDIERHLWDKS